ncbi:MAG: hypothetical protein PVG39_16700 [Desulfobacteraceae bacterium]|jgi:hypothetical protein
MKSNNFFNVVSLGAGRQSSYMLLRGLAGDFSVIPDAAVFSDTQNEPPYVYEFLDKLVQYCHDVYSFDITILRNESILESRQSLPYYINGGQGTLRRQCTTHFKIRPVRRFCQQNRSGRKVRLWIGVSCDEMERMRVSDVKYIKHFYPLVESRVTISSILKFWESHVLKVPGKSSCMVCPYHSDRWWRMFKKQFPKSFNSVCDFDESIRKSVLPDGDVFLHRSCVPLRNVDFSFSSSLFPELIEECSGLCGL